jgi:hypothetical protein
MSMVRDKAIKALGAGKTTDAILRKQVACRAKHRRARLQSDVKNRGRDQFLNQMEGSNKIEKQSTAGTRTSALRRKASVQAVADVYRTALTSGIPIVKSEIIAKVKTVSHSTAYDVYDDAVQLVRSAIRYTAKTTRHSCGTATRVPAVARSITAIPAKPFHVLPPRPAATGIPATIRDPNPCGPPATRSNHDPSENPVATPRPTVSHGIRSHEQFRSGNTLH